MASVFKFRCTEFTAGADTPFNINQETLLNEFQVVCVSGQIEISGSAGTILGVPCTPIVLESGQAFNFTEMQYEEITIVVKAGTTARFVANT